MQRRTLFRLDRSLRSEWRVGLSSVATYGPSRVRSRSLRSDRAVCVLGRYVETDLCNRFVALPFSAINLGVFCGFWENKFYPSERHYGVCVSVGHRRSGGWGCLTSVVANCDFVFRISRHCFDQAFCG
ncbi:hypothetical protein F2Q70_00015050 [Brassica cretica]|uniref:Uncharacterized protein n=1 Tax=Brassica cretica TaxID=69181 RepID=A0A8S9G4A4_BRACR|nr:hypothetical protein F2Q68_00031682 [Brassica cretica]KAF2561804.1 hypothetical protein F2Q70_00015050 [Brassica cretica]